MKAPIIVVGLGFGDEGKGTVVDFLTQSLDLDTVVRFNGGFQAEHNVVVGNTHHTFSAFGSGTLSGAKTLISDHVLVEPITLEREAEVLREKVSFEPFDRYYLSENCKITTVFHLLSNRLHTDKNGTTGMGVGLTESLHKKHPEYTLYVKDISEKDLFIQKLGLIRDSLSLENAEFYDLESIYLRYLNVLSRVNIISENAFKHMLRSDKLIFEGAQGALLDMVWGTYPNCTYSRTTKHNAVEILGRAGMHYYKTLGVMRTYMTRHGAGPLPTEHFHTDQYVEAHNKDIGFAGTFRNGYLDLNLIRYAIKANDGVDFIALTHLDKCANIRYSDRYTDDSFLYNYDLGKNLTVQRSFTSELMSAVAVYDDFNCNRADVVKFLESKLNVGIAVTSKGADRESKLIRIPDFHA